MRRIVYAANQSETKWDCGTIEELKNTWVGFGWGRTTRELLWNVWARRGDGLIFLGTGIADSHWIGPATVGHWATQHRAARAHTAPAVPTVVKSETRGRKGRTTHTALFDVNVRHPVARPCGVLDHSCNIHTYLLYQISPLLHFWRRINYEVQNMSMVHSSSLNQGSFMFETQEKVLRRLSPVQCRPTCVWKYLIGH